MKNKILLLIFCLLLLKVPFVFSEQNNNQEIQLKNTKYIQEPIFNSKVYFYGSANKFKTTVILVHGIGDDASKIWINLVPVLEKQYRVIYFDLPGFGRSDKADALYSPKNYAAFIKWIYDKYVDGPMYLIGHSMGGAISLCYAGTYPQSLQRLILVDAAGILYRAAFTKSLTSTKISQINKYKLFSDELDILNQFIETNLIDKTDQIIPKELSLILENSFLRSKLLRSPQKIASAALIYSDFTEQINNIKAPVFIIWGSKDPIAPLRTGKMLAFNIQGSTLNIMPGLGHNPMIDRPSDFNNLILKSLSDGPPVIQEKKVPAADKKTVTLIGKENQILEGDYTTIEIKDCRNIIINNATANNIKIINSWVEIENIFINSDKTAAEAIDSIVTVTGGNFTADVGLAVANSKIDLAGVTIVAKKAAILSTSNINSTVVFSICKIKSQHNSRNIHDIIEVSQDNPL